MGLSRTDHLAMYGDHGFPEHQPSARNIAQPSAETESELSKSLSEQAIARDEQTKLVRELTSLLRVVLRDPLPQGDSMGPACGYPPSSPLVNEVRRATAHIRANNLELDELIQRLTV